MPMHRRADTFNVHQIVHRTKTNGHDRALKCYDAVTVVVTLIFVRLVKRNRNTPPLKPQRFTCI